MTNNDIIRRLRYTFDWSDSQMIAIFGLANLKVTRSQVSHWLKKDDDEAFQECRDVELATFLNGLIIEKRGKKDGPPMEPEQHLTNNMTFKKLKIALNLRTEDVLDIMELVNFKLSEHELSAFFRKPGNKRYRECKDQVMRNFLHGIQKKYRDGVTPEQDSEKKDKKEDAPSGKETTN